MSRTVITESPSATKTVWTASGTAWAPANAPPARGSAPLFAPAARAPATCPSPPKQPAPSASAVPWASQRYDQSRLHALADGHGIVVAVIDSGVDARNPQLRDAVQPGPDQLDGGSSTLDCVGHGTAVAGIIAARPTPATKFYGLAPAATILALRVTEQTEAENGTTTGRRGTPTALANAIRDAVTRHAQVINLSLVSYTDDPAIREAVQYAVDNDVVLVAAVGNNKELGNKTPYPAAYDGVLGVGSITPEGQRAATSQTGSYVDLVAPGTQILTTATPDGLTTMEGTSFAAPFVSATAALLRQYRPDLTATQITAHLKATADGGQSGDGYGAGLLNPYRALTEWTDASPKPAPQSLHQPPTRPNPTAESAATRRTLTWALTGLTAIAASALLAAVIPRARRRNWRPGLLNPKP
ncbi:type VII secretion-associated serine protease mycosin [Dactylosporangium vinaceum]|uniref:Type VII secretion-associated serine protease mycosin n=1 Tax=Dactylosporangium vinaceum TaxID=53362 RepID=A0ABV5MLW4_9ACTN|nr:type VII secretion-associated serine protease mycosin [Dactylosporangium vinaceum]